MTIYVFTGPTLPPEAARDELSAVYLPPVSQGDVHRVAQRRPDAIGIIDGYFERVPAVWHKEILWAMAQGVHVYGSASMGALRAAELTAFGMVGIGTIYEAFRDGLLEDDDEVAVAHGAAESDYRALSEAMVNIRATLSRAEAEGIIGPASHSTLERAAKSLFYADRIWTSVLRRGHEVGVPESEIAALRAWLPAGRLDQKRADAVAMLRQMREDLAAAPARKRVRYRFEHTIWWDHASRYAGSLLTEPEGDDTVTQDALFDELRFSGDDYSDAHQRTILRRLALREASRLGHVPSPEAMQEITREFRLVRRLITPEELQRWLEENQLTWERFAELMQEEALLQAVRHELQKEVTEHLSDQLQLSGAYRRLLDRALDKQRVLRALGRENPGLDDAGLTEEDLLTWYFARRRGRVPDPGSWVPQRDGFLDEDAFRLAALREFCYIRSKAEAADGDSVAEEQARPRND
jgi:hypothetical protein